MVLVIWIVFVSLFTYIESDFYHACKDKFVDVDARGFVNLNDIRDIIDLGFWGSPLRWLLFTCYYIFILNIALFFDQKYLDKVNLVLNSDTSMFS